MRRSPASWTLRRPSFHAHRRSRRRERQWLGRTPVLRASRWRRFRPIPRSPRTRVSWSVRCRLRPMRRHLRSRLQRSGASARRTRGAGGAPWKRERHEPFSPPISAATSRPLWSARTPGARPPRTGLQRPWSASLPRGRKGRVEREVGRALATRHGTIARGLSADDDLPAAAAHLRAAAQADPSNPEVQEQLRQVADRAREIYLRAYASREDDPVQARQSFQLVGEILPQADETAEKARRWASSLEGKVAE